MWRRTDIRTLFHVGELFKKACNWWSLRLHCHCQIWWWTLRMSRRWHWWLCFSTVDHSRVKLSLNISKNDSDYINANFIKVRKSNIFKIYFWNRNVWNCPNMALMYSCMQTFVLPSQVTCFTDNIAGRKIFIWGNWGCFAPFSIKYMLICIVIRFVTIVKQNICICVRLICKIVCIMAVVLLSFAITVNKFPMLFYI